MYHRVHCHLGELPHAHVIEHQRRRQRAEVLSLRKVLPQATAAHDAEVLFFIGRHESMGRGIDDVDVHTIHP